MTAAVAAALELGQRDSRVKFVAGVKEENVGSRRVLEKNGFRCVGWHEDGIGNGQQRELDFEKNL